MDGHPSEGSEATSIDGASLPVGSYVGAIRAGAASWRAEIVQVRAGSTATVTTSSARRDPAAGATDAARIAIDVLAVALDESGLDTTWLSGILVDAPTELHHAVIAAAGQRFADVAQLRTLPPPESTPMSIAASPPAAVRVGDRTTAADGRPEGSSPQVLATAAGGSPLRDAGSGPPLRNRPSEPPTKRSRRGPLVAAGAIGATMAIVALVAGRDGQPGSEPLADDGASLTLAATSAVDRCTGCTTPPVETSGPLTAGPPILGDDAFSNRGHRRILAFDENGRPTTMIIADPLFVSNAAVTEAQSLGPFEPDVWDHISSDEVPSIIDYPCRGTSMTDDLSIATLQASSDGGRFGLELLRYRTGADAEAHQLAGTLPNCGWARRAEPGSTKVWDTDDRMTNVFTLFKHTERSRGGDVERIGQFRHRACVVTVYLHGRYGGRTAVAEVVDDSGRLFGNLISRAVIEVKSTNVMCAPPDVSEG